jgi:RimJ/RimL family protein N-acetyltransferase
MPNSKGLPNQIMGVNFVLKKIFSNRDKSLLEELLCLYNENRRHLYYWHRNKKELLFTSVEAYINYLKEGHLFCYILQISSKIIGCLEISHLDTYGEAGKYRAITFWIGEKHTRKGIMLNALSILEKIFFEQKINFLMADIDPDNEPSINLIEKLHYYVFYKVGYFLENGEIKTDFIKYRKDLNGDKPRSGKAAPGVIKSIKE